MSKLLVPAIAVWCVFVAARADEIWVCHFPGAQPGQAEMQFRLTDDFFASTGVPTSVYRVITNTDLALIAVDGSAYERLIGAQDSAGTRLVIQSNTIAINRKTGDAAMGFVSLYGSSRSETIRGQCVHS